METFKKTVLKCNLETLTKKIKKVNKILGKYGQGKTTYKVSEPRIEPRTFVYHTAGTSSRDDTKEVRYVEVVDVTITSEAVVKRSDKPFRFIGTVRFVDGIRQVNVREDAYCEYFTAKFRNGMCDHCHVHNENRLAYYLFVADDGEVVQVGSTCVQEYFGINSLVFLDAYDNLTTILHEPEDAFIDDDGGWYRRGVIGISFGEVYNALYYLTNGFTKWRKAEASFSDYANMEEWPTVSGVESIVTQPRTFHDILNAEVPTIVTAEDCLRYWEAQDGINDAFAFNCQQVMRAGYAVSRTLGVFCWAIYKVASDKVRAKTVRYTDDVLPCTEKEGSRVTVTGKVESFRKFEDDNMFSPRGGTVMKYAVNFKSDGKVLYSFITTSVTFKDVCEGDRIELRGTVGENRTFQGAVFTQLKRAKMERVIEKAEETCIVKDVA